MLLWGLSHDARVLNRLTMEIIPGHAYRRLKLFFVCLFLSKMEKSCKELP